MQAGLMQTAVKQRGKEGAATPVEEAVEEYSC